MPLGLIFISELKWTCVKICWRCKCLRYIIETDAIRPNNHQWTTERASRFCCKCLRCIIARFCRAFLLLSLSHFKYLSRWIDDDDDDVCMFGWDLVVCYGCVALLHVHVVRLKEINDRLLYYLVQCIARIVHQMNELCCFTASVCDGFCTASVGLRARVTDGIFIIRPL